MAKKKRYPKKTVIKVPVKRRSNPIDITDSQKKFIKDNYDELLKDQKKGQLDKDFSNYLNKIKAGKVRAKAPRFEGRMISAKSVELIKKIAKVKRKSFDTYVKDNPDIIRELQQRVMVLPEYMSTISNLIRKSNKKKIKIHTNKNNIKEVTRTVTKHEALFEIASFNNYVVSNTNSPAFQTGFFRHQDGSIGVFIPEGYDEMSFDELVEEIEDNDIMDIHISGDDNT